MKATVEQGITGRAVGDAATHQDVLNDEVIPVLRSARDALNFTSRFKLSANTADSPGAFKVIWESEQVPSAGFWLIEARVAMLDTAGGGATYVLRAAIQMTAGVPVIATSSADFSHESAAGFDWLFDVTATTVTLSVKDNGAEADASAVIDVLEVAR